MLELEALDVGYRSRAGDTTVARQIDLSLGAGEFVCLLGPNGAGKSTLMRTIAGMQRPLSGRVRVEGRDIQHMSARDRASMVGVVLTERVTAGLMTSYALVGLGRYPHTNWMGKLTKSDHEIIRHAIGMAGATALARRFVRELSDGERQRVMLARALAQQPNLMILDEITAFLDLPRRVEIMALLRGLARDTGCGMLISTHDLDLALRNADRVWLIDRHGTVRAGAPEDLVLTGRLAETFSDDRIDFDPVHGVLQTRTEAGPRVLLSGEASLQRAWTQRALERCGFRPCDADSQSTTKLPRVELRGEEGWLLHGSGEPQSFDTLYDLTRALVRHRGAPLADGDAEK